jgi:hypothetical protein
LQIDLISLALLLALHFRYHTANARIAEWDLHRLWYGFEADYKRRRSEPTDISKNNYPTIHKLSANKTNSYPIIKHKDGFTTVFLVYSVMKHCKNIRFANLEIAKLFFFYVLFDFFDVLFLYFILDY